MNQKNELFWISLTVFFTIVAWMLFDIYKAKVNTDIDTAFKNVQKIDFTIKTDVLDKLKEKSP